MLALEFTIFFLISSSVIFADDACKFKDPTKGVIDLTSLAKTDGKAAFPDATPPVGQNYKYSYNPCKPFSDGNPCINVAICQESQSGDLKFVVGTQESTKWTAASGDPTNPGPAVLYTAGEKKATVFLDCTTSDKAVFEALGEQPINNYKFTLSHKCACWDGCGSKPGPSGGGGGSITGGTVFILILIALALIYFVTVLAYNRFRHHRTGLELIPHRTFWVALPVHVKIGVLHTVRLVTGRGGYQAV